MNYLRNNRSLIISIIIATFLASCGNHKNPAPEQEQTAIVDTFDYKDNMAEYANTKFVPTMEHRISANTNAVYCVTLLYAWDEIRKIIQAPLTIPSRYHDLTLLNADLWFRNTLKPNEYTAEGLVQGDKIITRAAFKKNLPFDHQFESYDNRLKFAGTKVASFGFVGSHGNKCNDQARILYYQNDRHFLVKLIPEDTAHEILLYMPDHTFSTMSEMLHEVKQLTEKGDSERKQSSQKWKYNIMADDELIIPKFDFDISTVFNSLVGNRFSAANTDYFIENAWQRTAFHLDESGAAVASEATIICTLGIEEENPNKPQPKKMVFNRPFYVLLKRTNAANPYFVLWVANPELMVTK